MNLMRDKSNLDEGWSLLIMKDEFTSMLVDYESGSVSLQIFKRASPLRNPFIRIPTSDVQM